MSDDAQDMDLQNDDLFYLTDDDEAPNSVRSRLSINDPLPEPEQRHETLRNMYYMVRHQQTISLTPIYQRDVVWTPPKQTKLIDSLYRNFPGSSLTFNVTTDEYGTETWDCVDGKQRLTSITKHIDGEIPLVDIDKNGKKKKWYWKQSKQTKTVRNLLPNRLRREFLEKRIHVIIYRDLDEKATAELFQRLQGGVPLTIAERLNGIVGPWANYAHRIERRYMAKFEAAKVVESHRKEDFRRIIEVMYLINHLYAPKPPALGAANLEAFISNPARPSVEYKQRLTGTLAKLLEIVEHERYGQCFKGHASKVAPIEFTMSAVLVGKFRARLSTRRLAKAINLMIKDVRSKHVDIRGNSNVIKTLRSFINDEVMPDEEPVGSPPRRVSTPPRPPPSDSPPAASTSATRKRKIEDVSDDDVIVVKRKEKVKKVKKEPPEEVDMDIEPTEPQPASDFPAAPSEKTSSTPPSSTSATLPATVPSPRRASPGPSFELNVAPQPFPETFISTLPASPSPSAQPIVNQPVRLSTQETSSLTERLRWLQSLKQVKQEARCTPSTTEATSEAAPAQLVKAEALERPLFLES